MAVRKHEGKPHDKYVVIEVFLTLSYTNQRKICAAFLENQ